MKFVLALLIAALTLCDPAIAATGDPLDLQIRYRHYYASLLVNGDGTSVGSYEWSKTVLKEAALERTRRASVYYDTRAQKAEIIVDAKDDAAISFYKHFGFIPLQGQTDRMMLPASVFLSK